MLAKFSGNDPERTVCKFRKINEENVSVSFMYSIKWACAIRKFHVAVVQRRPRNVPKSSSCCFANLKL